jgi:hypothetical protein
LACAWVYALVCGTVDGVFAALASTAAAPPPTSPAALTAGWRLVGALRLVWPGNLIGTRRLRPWRAIAFCLRGAFRAARRGIAAVFPARPAVAPHVAISVAVSAVAIPIPVSAAPAAIAIVTRIAMCGPLAMGLCG